MWGCNYYNGAGFGHLFFGRGILGFSLTAIIIIAVAALIFRLIRSDRSVKSEALDKNDSFEILKIRFAKGEINEQEFKKMKDMLHI